MKGPAVAAVLAALVGCAWAGVSVEVAGPLLLVDGQVAGVRLRVDPQTVTQELGEPRVEDGHLVWEVQGAVAVQFGDETLVVRKPRLDQGEGEVLGVRDGPGPVVFPEGSGRGVAGLEVIRGGPPRGLPDG